jgi:hypothetical protein
VIRNTAADMNDPANKLLFLAESMATGNPSDAIYAMEKRGQTELVHSDRLPTEVLGDGGDDAFKAVGFEFGPADDHDPLFRPATLPDGWTREAADHDMGSYVVDPLGRRRVRVFYKAAFYDRRAHMSLITVYGYVSDYAWGGPGVVTDDAWATPAAVVEAARQILAKEEEPAPWRHSDAVAEAAERCARLEALIAKHT